VRAITDLELGDRCKQEKLLLLEEINLLEQTRNELFRQVILKDSTIRIYQDIDTAYQELQQIHLQKEQVHKTEIKRQKRAKRSWMLVTVTAIGYILFSLVKS
jgi:hypothetical protein